MKTAQTIDNSGIRLNHRGRRLIGLIAAASTLLAVGPVLADDPVSMAPPVNGDVTYSNDSADSSAAADSVFNWQEVPENQRVPIERATFDQGGYQLYDDAGETIVIPFTNNNLYVMKFAVSSDGKTYFINSGDAPVLYLPRDGFLVNAAVSGARWYPFSDGFKPDKPVFIGIAPSWDDYCNMGWYPSMYCYGGYWGRTSFLDAGIFTPTIGLVFVIGGHHFHGWEPYHHYYHDIDRSWHHITIVNRNIYRYGGRPERDNRTFHGGNHSTHYYTNSGSHGRSDYGGRVFHGTGHPFPVHHGSDHSFPDDHSGSHSFPSAGDSSTQHDRSRSFHGAHDQTRSHSIAPGITQGPASHGNSARGGDVGRAFPATGGSTAPRLNEHPLASQAAPSNSGREFRGTDRSFRTNAPSFPSGGSSAPRSVDRSFHVNSAPRETPRPAPSVSRPAGGNGGSHGSNDAPRNNSNGNGGPRDGGGRMHR